MKKNILCGVLCFAAGALVVGIILTKKRSCTDAGPVKPEAPVIRKTGKIYGYGYIRGRSRTSLCNKYGAFVKKVHIYSDKPVKKGDCILEYDDFDLRKKIVSQKNSIANTEKDLKEAETSLALTRLDPLPSEYRHINWKIKRAKELLVKAENEWRTYCHLFKSKSVSELDLKSKKQVYQDALAAYKIIIHDQETVNKGMRKLKIRAAEEKVVTLETKLAGLKKDLAVLEEERKFYKIITPYDGIIVTNSDTVHAWDNAGTSAAVIHRVHRGYYLYTYFEEKDIIHIPNGTPARFFSTDSGKWYDAVSFEVSSGRSAKGDKVYHLVKFIVKSPIDKAVTLDGNVIVEIKVK